MSGWKPDRMGYIGHYMVCGPLDVPYEGSTEDRNQLTREATLRHQCVRHEPADASCLSGRLGMPWRFWGGDGSSFVDLSDFYATLRYVRFDAATVLEVPQALNLSVTVWSYAAVDVYLNNELVGRIPDPVYKPIHSLRLRLPMKAGRNLLYLACENLGVRDTRSVVGVQITDGTDVTVHLPDEQCEQSIGPDLSFLRNIRETDEQLIFPGPAPAAARLTYRHDEYDFAKAVLPTEWHTLQDRTEWPLPAGEAWVTVELNGLVRRFERTAQILPKYVRQPISREENFRLIQRRIANVTSLSRGEKFGFPIANILARKALGDTGTDDETLMREMLSLIETRVDCSDFLVIGLIRYLRNYPVSPRMMEEIRRILVHWRYWMDMDGTDGMCFWSENHCLMFYYSAMAVGAMFPEDTFPLAGMKGKELSAWGRNRVLDWLADVEQNGFEEFLSTVYMCVTFAALIGVADDPDPEIAGRATRLTDRLLRGLALHTYKSGIIAPMGRVYRGVLYPFAQGAMALMNLIDPRLPWDYGEGWLGFLASSGYRLPDGLIELMEADASISYTTGNARIVLEKHRDWCLTSVQSPREPFVPWPNETLDPSADPHTHSYTKSYNERFHGTTDFRPGVCGYQQHLWYAALDGEAVIFCNHPGSTSDGGDMRPGYWHGNGVFPALKQDGDQLGMIYRIPETQPFHMIHLYFPRCRFDEVRRSGRWMIGKKGDGCLAFWSSAPMEAWTGLSRDCEWRMWGSDIACVCLCGSGSLSAMEERCRMLAPQYDTDTGTLTAGSMSLTYQAFEDQTQYL